MTQEELFDRIDQLEWNLENYQGWCFGLVREWKEELKKLRGEIHGTIL